LLELEYTCKGEGQVLAAFVIEKWKSIPHEAYDVASFAKRLL